MSPRAIGAGGAWAEGQLRAALAREETVVNPVIYAQFSLAYPRLESVDAFMAETRLTVRESPRAVLFLAGEAFLNDRRPGGPKMGVLPDFFIGAHAAVAGRRCLPAIRRGVSPIFPAFG
jgi:hypothetical protein